jgi:hypothetical protein
MSATPAQTHSPLEFNVHVDLTNGKLFVYCGPYEPEEWFDLPHENAEVGVTWEDDGIPMVQEVRIHDPLRVSLLQDWVEDVIIKALPESYKDNHTKGYAEYADLVARF